MPAPAKLLDAAARYPGGKDGPFPTFAAAVCDQTLEFLWPPQLHIVHSGLSLAEYALASIQDDLVRPRPRGIAASTEWMGRDAFSRAFQDVYRRMVRSGQRAPAVHYVDMALLQDPWAGEHQTPYDRVHAQSLLGLAAVGERVHLFNPSEIPPLPGVWRLLEGYGTHILQNDGPEGGTSLKVYRGVGSLSDPNEVPGNAERVNEVSHPLYSRVPRILGGVVMSTRTSVEYLERLLGASAQT